MAREDSENFNLVHGLTQYSIFMYINIYLCKAYAMFMEVYGKWGIIVIILFQLL